MSVPTQDVLIVHPNEGRRAALAEVLGVHRVVAVESQVEATRRMESTAPTLIIAPPENARRFLRHVDRAAPEAVRVFVCAQSDRQGLEELVETAAEGHVFNTLDDGLSTTELGRRITNILQLRASARVTPNSRMEAGFRLQGRGYTARCLDVGNFGAALQVPMDASVGAFLPGAVLDDLHIEREGRWVLQSRRALVRHVSPVRNGAEHALRLGLSWTGALEETSATPLAVVRDPVSVLAALRKAVRRGSALWVHYPDTPSVQFILDSPQVDLVDGRSVLRGANVGDCPVSGGDVLNLSFEVSGQSYLGVTSVLRSARGDVTLSVPRTLGVQNRRGLQRFRPGPDHRFLVSFSAPFSGKPMTRSVLDLSSRGLSFAFDASCEVLPAGSQLDMSLLLPDGSEVPCRAEVRSVDGVSSGEGAENPLRPRRCAQRGPLRLHLRAQPDGGGRRAVRLPRHLADDGGRPLRVPSGLSLRRRGEVPRRAGAHAPSPVRVGGAGQLARLQRRGRRAGARRGPAHPLAHVAGAAPGGASGLPPAGPDCPRAVRAGHRAGRGPRGHRLHPLLLARGQPVAEPARHLVAARHGQPWAELAASLPVHATGAGRHRAAFSHGSAARGARGLGRGLRAPGVLPAGEGRSGARARGGPAGGPDAAGGAVVALRGPRPAPAPPRLRRGRGARPAGHGPPGGGQPRHQPHREDQLVLVRRPGAGASGGGRRGALAHPALRGARPRAWTRRGGGARGR